MNLVIDIVLSFAFNFMVAFTIIRTIYFPQKQNKNYVFTLLAFNTVIYFVLSFLTSTEISIGAGFGLFAIFSILRYRTNTIPIREMTYLFVISALPVINSILLNGDNWPVLITVNVIIVLVLYVLEQGWGFHYELSKRITYENIDLIKPEHSAALLADLKQRTGLQISRVEIGRIDFLRDIAELKVYYALPTGETAVYSQDELTFLFDEG